MEIKFTVSAENLTRIVNAMKGLYPIPEIDGVPDFTDNAWAKEALRRIVVRDVKRWETKVAQENLEVQEDNSLIS